MTMSPRARLTGPGSGPGGVPAAIALSPILSARYRERDLERITAAAPGSRLLSVSLEGLADGDLSDVEVLLRGPLPAGVFDRLLARCPRLRWVHSATAGVERVLTPAALERGLAITNARGVFSDPIAEYVLMAILAVCRRLPQHLELMRERTWQPLEATELHDVTIGIVGFGSIGRRVADYLHPEDQGVVRQAFQQLLSTSAPAGAPSEGASTKWPRGVTGCPAAIHSASHAAPRTSPARRTAACGACCRSDPLPQPPDDRRPCRGLAPPAARRVGITLGSLLLGPRACDPFADLPSRPLAATPRWSHLRTARLGPDSLVIELAVVLAAAAGAAAYAQMAREPRQPVHISTARTRAGAMLMLVAGNWHSIARIETDVPYPLFAFAAAEFFFAYFLELGLFLVAQAFATFIGLAPFGVGHFQ